MPARGAPADHRHRRIGRQAVRHERAGDLADPIRAHENDLGAGRFRDLRKVQGGFLLGGIFVAGQDGETGAMVAMRERDARAVGSGNDRRNPWHHFKRDARAGELLGFLAPAAEDVGITAFESHDAFACARPGDEQLVEFVLRNRMVLGAFAAVNDLGGLRRQAQQVRIHQRVIDHHVGAREQFGAAQREQARVARPGAHQIDHAGRLHLGLKYSFRPASAVRKLGRFASAAALRHRIRLVPPRQAAGQRLCCS